MVASRCGGEASHVAREIERAQWMMDVESPAVRADDPLNRHAAAVRAQVVPVLTVLHLVDRALPIELRPAFSESEQRTRAEPERYRASERICLELLNEPVVGADPYREIARDFHLEICGGTRTRLADGQRCPLRPDQRTIVRDGIDVSDAAGQEENAHRHSADCLRRNVDGTVAKADQRTRAEGRSSQKLTTGQSGRHGQTVVRCGRGRRAIGIGSSAPQAMAKFSEAYSSNFPR